MPKVGWGAWVMMAILTAGCACARPLAAQMPNATTSVQGELEDDAGAPLPYANVELESWSGQPMGTAVTDGGGSFTFQGIPPGMYRLRGSYRGQAFESDFAANNPGVITIVRTHVGMRRGAKPAANPAGDVVSMNDLAAPKAAKKSLRQARAALRRHQMRQAMRLGSKAVAAAPHWGEARMFRGVLWMEQGQFRLAEQDLRAAVAANPNNAMALTALGADYERQHQLRSAGFYLQRAVQVQPGLWQEYFEMAQLELDENHPHAAIAAAGRALATIPAGPAAAHLLRANGYIRLRRWEAAKRDIELYLQVAPHGKYAVAAKRTLGEIQGLQRSQPQAPPR